MLNSLCLQQPSPVNPRIAKSERERKRNERRPERDEKPELVRDENGEERKEPNGKCKPDDISVRYPSENAEPPQNVERSKKHQEIEPGVLALGKCRENEHRC